MTGNCREGDDREPVDVPLNAKRKFDVDAEGAELFVGLEAPYLLARARQGKEPPSSMVRTMLNYGVLSLREADRGRWEQMNAVIDDPLALAAFARDAMRYGQVPAPHVDVTPASSAMLSMG
ncbi:hypothetical protein MHM84_20255 [Halomonas sp. McH1-25]|nr:MULTISPECIES: hypothetical protein [unclassified Halomonas]MCG7602078.1 hypothetical protein [Halomonas sp. McH1-25]MCP1362533.1 hypothetical protein [Halomonas sp. BBD45]MCP1363963.1 hypothetical protein [Halomonas sp. BBD48]